MTDVAKLRALSGLMVIPVRVSGVANFQAYPSPDAVKKTTGFPSGRERMEVLMELALAGPALHSTSISNGGQRADLRVLPGQLSTPQTCVVCGAPAVTQGPIEALGKEKMTYGKMTISGANAARVWDSIQRDRYWFTLPVCAHHQANFHEQVHLNAERMEGALELNLPNREWGQQFVRQNQVKRAVFKSKGYMRKLTLGLAALVLGLFGTILAIGLLVTEGAWVWLIPALALLAAGLAMVFTNPFELLVSDWPAPKDASNDKRRWLERFVSLRGLTDVLLGTGVLAVIVGVLWFFLKVNDEYLPGPWYVKGGVIALGVALGALSMVWSRGLWKPGKR